MLDAAQRDAVVREDVRVVFQMVADLRRRALEPRLEPREHGLAVQLIGRAGIAMRERNVGGLAGRDRQRDADELGAHVGQARRLGVERDERRGGDALAPALELGRRDDGFVAARRARGGRGLCGAARRRAGAGSDAAAAALVAARRGAATA